MKLLITTQCQENYGAHDWDGQGSCPQYWKMKGGNDYVILNYDQGQEGVGAVLAQVRGQFEEDNTHFREYVIGTEIVADDYLTEFERSQLAYEGKIAYPAIQLVDPVYYGA
jgi:hypothetical protein